MVSSSSSFSTLQLFADDTIAYMATKSLIDAQHLQQNIDKHAIWEAIIEKMDFNTEKCNVLSNLAKPSRSINSNL
jgi:hypothetical protein